MRPNVNDIVDRLRKSGERPYCYCALFKGYAAEAIEAAAEIERLQEVITDFVEAREALNKNEWCDDSGAFRSVYQDASRALEREARRG
jgi:hypothetical protein